MDGQVAWSHGGSKGPGHDIARAGGCVPCCANEGLIGDIACVRLGTATYVVFSAGTILVAGAVWLLDAAISFVIEDAPTGAASAIADLIDNRWGEAGSSFS